MARRRSRFYDHSSSHDSTFPDNVDDSHSYLASEITTQNVVQTVPLQFCTSSKLNFDLYPTLHLIVIEHIGNFLIGRLEWLELETHHLSTAPAVGKGAPCI